MARRLSVLAIGLVAVLSAGPLAQSPTLTSVMREKLGNTQKLLEAIVTADYPGLNRYGEELSHITYTEIASWQANAQPQYLHQANTFLSSVKGLRAAAADRDLEAATSAYTTLISSCIQCHALVRRSRVASLAPFDPLLAGDLALASQLGSGAERLQVFPRQR